MSCPHPVLVKVTDELGLMRGEGAEVLRAHYECRDCGTVMFHTENRDAITRRDLYYGVLDRFENAGDAIAGAIDALRRSRHDPRKALPTGEDEQP